MDPHATIAAILQYLMIQHEQGRPVDMGALLAVLTAFNELLAARPASIAASGAVRDALAQLGVAV